jgi:hypothetical protein
LKVSELVLIGFVHEFAEKAGAISYENKFSEATSPQKKF